MTTYDPQVIYTFADSLYSRAAQVIVTSTLVGLLIGGSAGYAIGYAMHAAFRLYAIFGALLGAALRVLDGYGEGIPIEAAGANGTLSGQDWREYPKGVT